MNKYLYTHDYFFNIQYKLAVYLKLYIILYYLLNQHRSLKQVVVLYPKHLKISKQNVLLIRQTENAGWRLSISDGNYQSKDTENEEEGYGVQNNQEIKGPGNKPLLF